MSKEDSLGFKIFLYFILIVKLAFLVTMILGLSANYKNNKEDEERERIIQEQMKKMSEPKPEPVLTKSNDKKVIDEDDNIDMDNLLGMIDMTPKPKKPILSKEDQYMNEYEKIIQEKMKKIEEEKKQKHIPKRVIKLKENYGLNMYSDFIIEECEDMLDRVLSKYDI